MGPRLQGAASVCGMVQEASSQSTQGGGVSRHPCHARGAGTAQPMNVWRHDSTGTWALSRGVSCSPDGQRPPPQAGALAAPPGPSQPRPGGSGVSVQSLPLTPTGCKPHHRHTGGHIYHRHTHGHRHAQALSMPEVPRCGEVVALHQAPPSWAPTGSSNPSGEGRVSASSTYRGGAPLEVGALRGNVGASALLSTGCLLSCRRSAPHQKLSGKDLSLNSHMSTPPVSPNNFHILYVRLSSPFYLRGKTGGKKWGGVGLQGEEGKREGGRKKKIEEESETKHSPCSRGPALQRSPSKAAASFAGGVAPLPRPPQPLRWIRAPRTGLWEAWGAAGSLAPFP